MKTPHTLIVLALFAFCQNPNRVIAAEVVKTEAGKTFTMRQDKPPQVFKAKVVKVFAANDGEATFRAYLVVWKDQEVIVSDTFARSTYKTGDVVTVVAMNQPIPGSKESHRLLSFTIGKPTE